MVQQVTEECITLRKGDDGFWTAESSIYPIVTQGATITEALANIREAIALWLEVDEQERQARIKAQLQALAKNYMDEEGEDDGKPN